MGHNSHINLMWKLRERSDLGIKPDSLCLHIRILVKFRQCQCLNVSITLQRETLNPAVTLGLSARFNDPGFGPWLIPDSRNVKANLQTRLSFSVLISFRTIDRVRKSFEVMTGSGKRWWSAAAWALNGSPVCFNSILLYCSHFTSLKQYFIVLSIWPGEGAKGSRI